MTLSTAFTAPLPHKRAIQTEHHQAVIAFITYKHQLFAHRDATRTSELSFSTFFSAPLPQERTGHIEDLDAMVVTIADQNDNSPVFSNAHYEATLTENEVPSDEVLAVLRLAVQLVVNVHVLA